MTKKRDDLQGTRGAAILAVLAFHFQPRTFANGFLGVDMFFVLSGYLVTYILRRKESISISNMFDFYSRRFKRIVPLYAITLLIATVALMNRFDLLIATTLIFIPTDLDLYIRDLLFALGIATNMENILWRKDYWSDVSIYQVLLHTWSLGVEMQFYLLAPLLVLVFRGVGRSKILQGTLGSALIMGSFVFHSTASSSVSFGLVLCRLWQFGLGGAMTALPDISILQGIEEKVMDPGGERPKDAFLGMLVNYAISFSCLLLMTTPVAMSHAMCRLLVTLSTAAVIALGSMNENPLFSTRILVHFGDLSYVLYLVHWPAIVLWKYYWNVVDLECRDIAILLAGIYIVSLLVHHSLERIFIEQSTLPAVITVAVVYALLLTALLFQAPQRYAEYVGPTSEAIRANRAEMGKNHHITKEGYDVDDEVEAMIDYSSTREDQTGIIHGNGTAKVLIIGNSVGFRASRSIEEAFRGRYAVFRVLLEYGCSLLVDDNCPGYKKVVKRLLAKWKPDIIFVVAWEDPEFYLKPVSDPLTSDAVLQRMQGNLDWISNATGVVVVDSALRRLPLHESFINIMVRALSKGRELGDFKAPWEDYIAEYRHQRTRFDALRAPNLVKNHVMEQMCTEEKGVCYFYNRNNSRAYYLDLLPHLTTEGLKLLAPGYQKIVDDFLRKFLV